MLLPEHACLLWEVETGQRNKVKNGLGKGASALGGLVWDREMSQEASSNPDSTI